MFRKKKINTYLMAKNSLHTTRISSFKYVFFLFRKNLMLKYTFNLQTQKSQQNIFT